MSPKEEKEAIPYHLMQLFKPSKKKPDINFLHTTQIEKNNTKPSSRNETYNESSVEKPIIKPLFNYIRKGEDEPSNQFTSEIENVCVDSPDQGN